MNTLSSEIARLFLIPAQGGVAAGAPPGALIGPGDTVRAMVLELAHPPDWALLSQVWRGVQAELDLPAPAIAVSGTDGLQLWFSLTEPVAVVQAHGFLEGLRQRFLPEVDARRLRLLPAATASASRQEGHAPLVPAPQATGNWSAFLAPDLAPIFGETPWLDIPPSEEGQANLLRSTALITPAAFAAAMALLTPATPAMQVGAAADNDGQAATEPQRSETADARRFLRQVMLDEAVALALRIEAAKALLQSGG